MTGKYFLLSPERWKQMFREKPALIALLNYNVLRVVMVFVCVLFCKTTDRQLIDPNRLPVPGSGGSRGIGRECCMSLAQVLTVNRR